MPLLPVTKTERLPAISCGFVPFLRALTRSCSSSTMLASGPRQPLALAPWPHGRAENAVRAETSVAAGLEGRLATGGAVLQGLGHARRGAGRLWQRR
eukprot:2023836-Pyramimonas_sp.AAC.1